MKKLLILLMLAGCSGTPIISTVVQKDAPVAIPTAQPLTLNDVQFTVLTVDQLKALLTKLEAAQQKNAVVFALDTQNYTNLQLNLVEIQRYIKEQKAILDMLKQILAERSGQPLPQPAKPVK